MANIPRYLEIRDRIREEFLSAVEIGSVCQLPSERQLEQRYHVSRPTIAKAIASLAADGEVISGQGRARYLIARPSAVSRSLGGRRIGYVASIATETLTRRTMLGIEREAVGRGYRVLMANADGRVDGERDAVLSLIASGVSGLVIYPTPRPEPMEGKDYLESADLGVPVVLVDLPTEAHPHTQFIFDNEQLGYDLTLWLISEGHRRIVYATADRGIAHPSIRARVQGFYRAARALGLPEDACRVVRYDGSMESPAAVAKAILDAPDPPTAVLATEDRAAMDLIEAFAAMGVRVPEDLCVVGFDDLQDPRRLGFSFPTTRPNFEKLGEHACRRLLDIVEGHAAPGRVYVFEVPMVIRRGSDGRHHDGPTAHPRRVREGARAGVS